MGKKKLVKIGSIILICVVIDIALHLLTSKYSTMPKFPNYSKLAEQIGTEVTVTLWALLAFSSAAYVFFRAQDSIVGVGIKKGIRYGSAIALLWLFAMMEGVSLFGNSIINEFVVGLSDAIPVFVLGTLLSKLQFENFEGDRPKTFVFRQKARAISIFTVIFLTGRYIAYLSGVIQSGNQTRPLQTFIWTLLMGISIGAVFVLLDNNRNERSLIYRAVKFGFLIFGLNWAAFLVFMPFLFSGYIADVFLRVLIDSTMVTIASYLALIPRGDFKRKTSVSKT